VAVHRVRWSWDVRLGRIPLRGTWKPQGEQTQVRSIGHEERLAKSTVYKILFHGTQESLPGLPSLDGIAQFVEGGDVFDSEDPSNNVIKVSGYRRGFGNPIKEIDDPVLHRLVLASRGRKLYEYETFSQLMKGTKKMVRG
jgi:hypothetical protein